MDIFLRPLKIDDALTSYKWRNNPIVWELTGNKPNRIITPEIETEWITKALSGKDEVRFAICIEGTKEYIGNVQLTNIKDNKAEFHIFIGESKYWRQGIGTKATAEMLKIGFKKLLLTEIYLYVNKKNIAAIKSYLNCGFTIEVCEGSLIKMNIKSQFKD